MFLPFFFPIILDCMNFQDPTLSSILYKNKTLTNVSLNFTHRVKKKPERAGESSQNNKDVLMQAGTQLLFSMLEEQEHSSQRRIRSETSEARGW